MDASEWEKIEKKPKGRLPLKYIFAYILGDNSSVKQLKKNAEKWDISVIEFDGKMVQLDQKNLFTVFIMQKQFIRILFMQVFSQ